MLEVKEQFMGSNRRAKFKEIGERRVSRAIEAIRLVGNLANKSNYDYTDEDVKQLTRALQDALQNVKAKFSGSSKKKNFKFK